MKPWSSVCAVLLSLSCALVAQGASQIDVYHFDDAEQQRHYKALIEEFRCPKCLNTNIAGSDAPIAQDLRRTVHKLVVVDGYTDQEVRDFLQQRYGDFVTVKLGQKFPDGDKLDGNGRYTGPDDGPNDQTFQNILSP